MSTEQPQDPGQNAPVAAEGPVPSKIIKRYSNRKLYDTERSKYVTLDEIAKMIKAGDEVTIIDNESKEDLTSLTLTQIIYEEEKRESRMPLAMLRNLIQTGGSAVQEFFDRSVVHPVSEAQRTVEKRAEELRQSAARLQEVAARSVTELTESARRMLSREERRAEEFRKAAQQTFDHLDVLLTARTAEVRESLAELEVRAKKAKAAGEEPVADDAARRNDSQVMFKVGPHVELLRQRLQVLSGKIDELERTQEAPPPRED